MNLEQGWQLFQILQKEGDSISGDGRITYVNHQTVMSFVSE